MPWWEDRESGEHDWVWDDYVNEEDIPSGDLFCLQCYHYRDFSIDESEEPKCPKNLKE